MTKEEENVRSVMVKKKKYTKMEPEFGGGSYNCARSLFLVADQGVRRTMPTVMREWIGAW